MRLLLFHAAALTAGLGALVGPAALAQPELPVADTATVTDRLDDEPGLRFVAAWREPGPGRRPVRAQLHYGVVYAGDEALRVGPGELDSVRVTPDLFAPGMARLSLRLGAGAAERFRDLTVRGMGRPLAVVVNGRVLVAPTVQGPIYDGGIEITGLEPKEIRRVALTLRRLVRPSR